MGLSITCGELAETLKESPEEAEWIQEDIVLINETLESAGFEQHEEPEVLPEFEYLSCTSFPYGFLHYLRRAYALQHNGDKVTEVDGDISTQDEALIDDLSQKMSSHLLCHSDAEGYYVPQDFSQVILSDELPGVLLGSTNRLWNELKEVAPHLRIELVDGMLTPGTEQALREFNEDHPFHRERVAWFALYENCQYSLQFKTLITFG